MAITFGKQIQANGLFRGTNNGTIHTSLSQTNWVPYTATSVAGDYIMFMQSNVNSGKFSKLVLNVATAAVGTITGVWEYCQYTSSLTVPTWVALSNVVDQTNGFTVAGTGLTVTFDRPDDEWSNRMNPGNNSLWYQWNIRFRITSISGVTNYGNVTSTQTWSPNYMLSGSATHTFNDIYQDDLANGRGYIKKNGNNSYYFNTTLHADTSCTLTTKNEYVYFGRNHHMVNYGILLAGEIDATTGLTKNGSTIVWEVYKGDKNGCFFGWVYSRLYDSSFGCVFLTTESQGFWGGGFGSVSDQVIKDCRIFGARSYQFTVTSNIFKGLKCTEGQTEPLGSTLIELEFGNSQYATRGNNTFSGAYLHRTDVSKMAANTSNPYQISNTAWTENWVDTKFKSNQNFNTFVKWSAPASFGDFFNARVRFLSSLELLVADRFGNAISNCGIRITNNSTINLTYSTNSDGYVAEYRGAVVSNALNTSSLLYFSGFTGTGLRFREIIMTSGAMKGERSVIHAAGTDNITLAEPLSGIPAVGDRFVVIPYIEFGNNKPNPTMLVNQLVDGVYTYNGPFFVTVTKPGYNNVRYEEEFKRPVKQQVIMLESNIQIDQEGSL